MTTVEDNQTSNATTVMEFFVGLGIWTYVRLNDVDHIFVGFEYVSGDPDVVLYNVNSMTETVLTYSTLSNDNPWLMVTDEQGFPLLADIVVRNAVRTLRSRDAAINRLEQHTVELEKSLSQVVSDFRTVNEKLNEFAVDKGYCSDYEYYINQWNEELTSLRLEGRPRDHDVAVRFTGFPDFVEPLYVRVNATSEQDARDKVALMSAREIIRQAVERESYFYGFEPQVVQD